MKWLVFLLIVLIIMIVTIHRMGKNTQCVRYDGLYCFVGTKNTNYVLRFYENGNVISSSISGDDPRKVYFPKRSWFHFDNITVSKGSYTLGNTIRFKTESVTGSVVYWGKVYDGYMILHCHSNINGHESKHKYVFCPFDEIDGWYD